MNRSMVRITVLVVAFAMLAGYASAQVEKWNQEATTGLAGELEAAVSGLRDAVRKSPKWESQRRTLYKIADKLRLIESESASLHAQLVNGAGMEETQPSYERIQRLRRDVQVLAVKTDVSAFTKPKLDKATEVLEALAHYYPVKQPPKS